MSDLRGKLKQNMAQQASNDKFLQLLNARTQQKIKDKQIVPAIPLSAFNPSGLPTINNEKLKPKERSSSQRKLRTNKKQTSREIKEQIRKGNSLTKRQQPEKRKVFFGSISRKNLILKTPNKMSQNQPDLELTNVNSNLKQTKLTNNKTLAELIHPNYENILLNVKFSKIQQTTSYRSFIKREQENGLTSSQIIKKLDRWITRYKIKSGLIETKDLFKIFSKKSISNYTILCTFTNRQQLHRQYVDKIPGLRYYTPQFPPKGKNLAVLKIQSLFKMIFDRKYSRKLSSLMNKVKIIQKHWRNALFIRRTRERIMQSIAQKMRKVQEMNVKLMKDWDILKTSKRIEIHLCSYSVEEFKRLTTQNLRQRQMCQITRMFRALKTDVTVIYVSPIQLSSQILRYYERIFEFENKQKIKDKLFFISLEETSSIEMLSYITTTSLLLYNSKALARIKKIIKDMRTNSYLPTTAYIVPNYPSTQYINLASELQVPIFAGSQHISKVFSSKSGFKQFLKPIINEKSSLQLLKSAYTIYTQKQLINTLSVLIHKNKNVEKWYLKIQDEVNSRGLAVLNINSMSFLRELKKVDHQLSDKDIIKLISDQLMLKLKKRLKILSKNVYSTYEQFLSHFVTRGGVIEAAPQNKCTQHSISFLIEPNGQFHIIGTYSRLQLGGKTVNSSIKFPSDSSIDDEKIIRELYRKLWLKHKLFGYFTVDLLLDQKLKKNYVIGMDLFLNQKTCSMFVPEMIARTNYNKQTNQLTIIKENTQQSIETHCLYCPMFNLDNVPTMQKFFKLCKFNNVAFDLEKKLGTMFLMVDQIENGCIGFLSSATTVESMLSQVKKVIDFLSKQFRKLKSSSDQIGLLRGVLINWLRKYERKTKPKEDLNLSLLF